MIGNKPSHEVLNAIILSNLNISSNWLLTGRGEMLKDTIVDKKANASKKYDAEVEIDNNGYLKLK